MLHKIDPDLLYKVKAQNSSNSLVECIVYASNYLSTKQHLHKIINKGAISEYPFIMAFGVKADFLQLQELANIREVSYIGVSSTVNTLINVSKKVLNLKPTVFPYAKNVPYTIAVIDTGISPILDFTVPQNRLVHFEDFVNHKTAPYDDNGHGTFVSSILAGNGMVSGGKYAGIVPNAFLISLKALDENGETGAMTILEAMQWVYDNRRKYNIKVVCMSFGSGTIGKKDPLIIGAEVLWNTGVCVVGAAGNSGPMEETIKSPGAANKIITVGALDDKRTNLGDALGEFSVADFSSRGPVFGNYKPDLIAPGANIVAACSYQLHKKHYKVMSGTSVATPMVAGICALLVNSNKKFTPNEIKRLLVSHCDPIVNDRNAEGFGLLNCTFLNSIKIN